MTAVNMPKRMSGHREDLLYTPVEVPLRWVATGGLNRTNREGCNLEAIGFCFGDYKRKGACHRHLFDGQRPDITGH